MRRFFLAIFSVLVLFPLAVSAGPPLPGTGCDSDFMDVLEVHAWMQGKQDLESAQELLTRPNSILEISCFEVAANLIGNYSDVRFPGLMLSPTISVLVNSSLRNYFNNFTLTDTSAPVCTWMRDVWQTAKCVNIDRNKFWTLADMQARDPRMNFQACNPNQRNLWQAAVPAAYPVPASPPASGGMERMVSHLNILAPTTCNNTVAIETGLMVKYVTSQTPFVEKTCLAPGCWYNNASRQCEN